MAAPAHVLQRWPRSTFIHSQVPAASEAGCRQKTKLAPLQWDFPIKGGNDACKQAKAKQTIAKTPIDKLVVCELARSGWLALAGPTVVHVPASMHEAINNVPSGMSVAPSAHYLPARLPPHGVTPADTTDWSQWRRSNNGRPGWCDAYAYTPGLLELAVQSDCFGVSVPPDTGLVGCSRLADQAKQAWRHCRCAT